MSEQDLTRNVIAALNATGVCEVWRTQSGLARVRGAWMHLAPPGTPDVTGFMRDGRFVGVEVKLPREHATAVQLAALERIRKAGGVAGVVRGVGEAVLLVVGALERLR